MRKKICDPLHLMTNKSFFLHRWKVFNGKQGFDSDNYEIWVTFNSWVNLPTTSMSPETIIVWKDGKSADTSHENLPEVAGETCDSTNWLSFDDDAWNGSVCLSNLVLITKKLSLKKVIMNYGTFGSPQHESPQWGKSSSLDFLSASTGRTLASLYTT